MPSVNNLDLEVESISHLFFMVNSKGLIVWMSPSASEILGYEATSFFGRDFHETFPKHDMSTVLGDSTKSNSVCTFSRGDGTQQLLQIHHFGVAENHEFDSFLARDVTGSMAAGEAYLSKVNRINERIDQKNLEIKQLRKRLDWEKRGLRNTVSFSKEFMFRWDTSGSILEFDSAFASTFGLAGKTQVDFFDLVYKKDHQKIHDQLQSFRSVDPIRKIEFRALLGDGRIAWCRKVDFAVFGKNETILEIQSVGGVKSSPDSNDVAAYIDSISEWLSFVIHDSRQPLQAISTSAGTLDSLLRQDPIDRETLIQASKTIAESVDYANSLLRQNWQFSKQGRFVTRPHDLASIALAATRLVQHQINRAGVELQLNVSDVQMNCDDVQIKQLFVNLITNAIDSVEGNPAGRRNISILASRKGDYVDITVSDNGPGLGASSHTIFELFQTSKKNHSGIGLAICQRIVDLHAGSITYVPNKPGGSTFCVQLPASRPESNG